MLHDGRILGLMVKLSRQCWAVLNGAVQSSVGGEALHRDGGGSWSGRGSCYSEEAMKNAVEERRVAAAKWNAV